MHQSSLNRDKRLWNLWTLIAVFYVSTSSNAPLAPEVAIWGQVKRMDIYIRPGHLQHFTFELGLGLELYYKQ